MLSPLVQPPCQRRTRTREQTVVLAHAVGMAVNRLRSGRARYQHGWPRPDRPRANHGRPGAGLVRDRNRMALSLVRDDNVIRLGLQAKPALCLLWFLIFEWRQFTPTKNLRELRRWKALVALNALIPHTGEGESFNRVGIAPRVSGDSHSKHAGRCPRG